MQPALTEDGAQGGREGGGRARSAERPRGAGAAAGPPLRTLEYPGTCARGQDEFVARWGGLRSPPRYTIPFKTVSRSGRKRSSIIRLLRMHDSSILHDYSPLHDPSCPHDSAMKIATKIAPAIPPASIGTPRQMLSIVTTTRYYIVVPEVVHKVDQKIRPWFCRPGGRQHQRQERQHHAQQSGSYPAEAGPQLRASVGAPVREDANCHRRGHGAEVNCREGCVRFPPLAS